VFISSGTQLGLSFISDATDLISYFHCWIEGLDIGKAGAGGARSRY
jgi:hypothetical protein